MLGNHADHFMRAQMRERVVALTPNAGGRSMVVPDRERPGTAQVTVKGGFHVPGPQRTVTSAFVPGMGTVEAPPPPPTPAGMLPGMGCCNLPGVGEASMLPGMGGFSMLPGMGALGGEYGKLIVPVLAVAAAWFLLKGK